MMVRYILQAIVNMSGLEWNTVRHITTFRMICSLRGRLSAHTRTADTEDVNNKENDTCLSTRIVCDHSDWLIDKRAQVDNIG